VNQRTIPKYHLEIRAKELFYDNKSEYQIAAILTQESGHPISRSAVHRYFESLKLVKEGLVSRQENLKVRSSELILDTIQARHEIINELRALAMQAKNENDIKTALMGLDRAVSALDSLDRRLGNFMPETQVNVGIGLQTPGAQHEQQFTNFMKVVLEVVDMDTRARIVSKLDGAMNVIDVPATCVHTGNPENVNLERVGGDEQHGTAQ